MKLLAITFSLILFFSLLQAESQTPADIFDPKRGDFLDIDRQEILNQAWEYYQQQEWEKSATFYLEALQLNIEDSSNIYNLACCYGLLGRPYLAGIYLQRAFAAGFRNIEHIRNDPDFNPVRNDPDFTEVMNNLETISHKSQNMEIRYFRYTSFLNYGLILPDDYQPSTEYPLLVMLHGLGDTAGNFAGIAVDIKNMIIVVPETPYAIPAGNQLGYSWPITDSDQQINMQSWLLSADYVAELIRELKNEFKIAGTFVFGFSQGACLAYLAGLKYPDMIDAIAPFGGWLPDELPDSVIHDALDLKVFIVHGEEDRIVEFQNAESAKQRLDSSGITSKLVSFPGGHHVPFDLFTASLKWMQDTITIPDN